jgi:hypothetical protein
MYTTKMKYIIQQGNSQATEEVGPSVNQKPSYWKTKQAYDGEEKMTIHTLKPLKVKVERVEGA